MTARPAPRVGTPRRRDVVTVLTRGVTTRGAAAGDTTLRPAAGATVFGAVFGCFTARDVPFGCVTVRDVAFGCLTSRDVTFGCVTARGAARCGAATRGADLCGAARCGATRG